jgi:hypothetical protein
MGFRTSTDGQIDRLTELIYRIGKKEEIIRVEEK